MPKIVYKLARNEVFWLILCNSKPVLALIYWIQDVYINDNVIALCYRIVQPWKTTLGLPVVTCGVHFTYEWN